MPTKVNSIEHLKEILSNGESQEFVIKLNLCLRSRKHISFDGEKFYVFNYIDDSEQELTEAQIMDENYTNIGNAITRGSFYLM